jgi:Cu(I)/Ag(I) efflux system membrane protein CusA/SilA
MVGGMVTSTVLTLIVIPVVYEMWRGWEMRHAHGKEKANA